jgi:hypothetical protein
MDNAIEDIILNVSVKEGNDVLVQGQNNILGFSDCKQSVSLDNVLIQDSVEIPCVYNGIDNVDHQSALFGANKAHVDFIQGQKTLYAVCNVFINGVCGCASNVNQNPTGSNVDLNLKSYCNQATSCSPAVDPGPADFVTDCKITNFNV